MFAFSARMTHVPGHPAVLPPPLYSQPGSGGELKNSHSVSA